VAARPARPPGHGRVARPHPAAAARAPPQNPPRSSVAQAEAHLEVVGGSPRVEFFKDFDLGKVTAVQYCGMTHAEFMKLTAPFWHKW
jgi:hypothetical protein